jgi:hypothetical protein
MRKLPRFPCNDCEVDCLKIGDWYMAPPRIWEDRLGLSWQDNLCIACLEKRLGRKLRPGVLDIGPASTFYPGTKLSARLTALWAQPKKKRKRVSGKTGERFSAKSKAI